MWYNERALEIDSWITSVKRAQRICRQDGHWREQLLLLLLAQPAEIPDAPVTQLSLDHTHKNHEQKTTYTTGIPNTSTASILVCSAPPWFDSTKICSAVSGVHAQGGRHARGGC